MRDNSSVFFSWIFISFGQKEPVKVHNFRLLTAQMKFHQLWSGSFVERIKNFSWKSTEELYLMALKSDAKFEEKLICFKKGQEFGEFWPKDMKV